MRLTRFFSADQKPRWHGRKQLSKRGGHCGGQRGSGSTLPLRPALAWPEPTSPWPQRASSQSETRRTAAWGLAIFGAASIATPLCGDLARRVAGTVDPLGGHRCRNGSQRPRVNGCMSLVNLTAGAFPSRRYREGPDTPPSSWAATTGVLAPQCAAVLAGRDAIRSSASLTH